MCGKPGGEHWHEAAAHRELHFTEGGREKGNELILAGDRSKGNRKQGGDRAGDATFRWVVREGLSEEGACEQGPEMCRRQSGKLEEQHSSQREQLAEMPRESLTLAFGVKDQQEGQCPHREYFLADPI